MVFKVSLNLLLFFVEIVNGGNRRLGIMVFLGGMFNCGFEYYEERFLRLWYFFNVILESSCFIRFVVFKWCDVYVLYI